MHQPTPSDSAVHVDEPIEVAPDARRAGRDLPNVSTGYDPRPLELAACVLAAPFALPVGLGIALGLCACYGYAPLYTELRVGRGGREFRLLKFRTLTGPAPRADDLTGRLGKSAPPASSAGRFARFLRRSSLDELPQLLNVLRGEMALVGPRPMPRAELARRFGADGRRVVSVRPGLTGLWQVSGRNDVDDATRRALDLRYVEERGPRLDAAILLRTVGAVLSGRGAY